jgi:hypothetical protein
MLSRIPDRWKTVLQLFFLLALGAAVVVFVITARATKPEAVTRSVTFRVEASGGFSIITLDAGSVSIPKSTTVSTPWQRTVQVPSGEAVYLTASNPTRTGILTCTISYDKEAWQKESTDAPKDGVACAGVIP